MFTKLSGNKEKWVKGIWNLYSFFLPLKLNLLLFPFSSLQLFLFFNIFWILNKRNSTWRNVSKEELWHQCLIIRLAQVQQLPKKLWKLCGMSVTMIQSLLRELLKMDLEPLIWELPHVSHVVILCLSLSSYLLNRRDILNIYEQIDRNNAALVIVVWHERIYIYQP